MEFATKPNYSMICDESSTDFSRLTMSIQEILVTLLLSPDVDALLLKSDI